MSRFIHLIAIAFSVLIAASLAWLGALNFEETLDQGQTFYLELRPADPRSIMQGDYMRLAYEADQRLESEQDNPAFAAFIVWANREAEFTTLTQTPAADDLKTTVFVPVQKVGQRALIQPRSFFFQEGSASDFARARFAVFKYSSPDAVLLSGLADKDKKLIVSK